MSVMLKNAKGVKRLYSVKFMGKLGAAKLRALGAASPKFSRYVARVMHILSVK